ncbi:MAG TPA: flagellar motor protein MotB [Alphaproteobacteria bacterium]
MAEETNQPVIIVKKKGKGHSAHHGGAWKVAYADFVTAMMAFFLLLWLLNVTTDDQKKGIAQYFTPESVSRSTSGSGGILGGSSMAPGAMPRDAAGLVMGIPLAPTGEQSDQEAPDKTPPPENVQNPDPDAEELAAAIKEANAEAKQNDKDKDKDNDKDLQGLTNEELQKALAAREEKEFTKAESELRQAIQEVPELKPLQENLIIDRTPEGLRIQIVDQQKNAMFPVGSPNPNEQMRQLMTLIARVVKQLPNPVSVTGHTDSLAYKPGAQYTNWELSSDRANASRRALLEGGLTPDRIKYVTGKAETEPLFSDNPADPRNRRISVVLLRDVQVPGAAAGAAPAGATAPAAPTAAPVTPASAPAGGPAVPSPSQVRRAVRG